MRTEQHILNAEIADWQMVATKKVRELKRSIFPGSNSLESVAAAVRIRTGVRIRDPSQLRFIPKGLRYNKEEAYMHHEADQPEPFTPGVSKAEVRQHAFLLYRDKLRNHPLSLEDWVLAEKDLVKEMQTEGVTAEQPEGR